MVSCLYLSSPTSPELRMLRLARLVRSASTDAASSGMRVLTAVASRLPDAGLSHSHLRTLLEDAYPLFTPGTVGALSLLEAVQMHPQLFTVSTDSSGDWSVRRSPLVEKNKISVSALPAVPRSAHAPDLESVYARLCEHLRAESTNGHNGFVSLEAALRTIGFDAEVAVAEILADAASRQEVETDLALDVRLVRRPRAAVVLIDGSELPATAVNDMCEELCLIKEQSTVFIARHGHHTPLSAIDTVVPQTVPIYLCIEKRARQLALHSPLILKDIVYMCSARQFSAYAEHVASINGFPDADVYVCCPSRIQLVQRKVLIPLEASES